MYIYYITIFYTMQYTSTVYFSPEGVAIVLIIWPVDAAAVVDLRDWLSSGRLLVFLIDFK